MESISVEELEYILLTSFHKVENNFESLLCNEKKYILENLKKKLNI
jgi:hypothetical protein